MPTPFIIFLVLAVIAIIVTVAAKLIHHRNRDQRDADEIISRPAAGPAARSSPVSNSRPGDSRSRSPSCWNYWPHPEHTSLCHKPVGGQFTTLVNTLTVLPMIVERLPDSGRGSASPHNRGLPVPEVSVAAPTTSPHWPACGRPRRETGACHSIEHAELLIADLSAVLGTVYSGHPLRARAAATGSSTTTNPATSTPETGTSRGRPQTLGATRRHHRRGPRHHRRLRVRPAAHPARPGHHQPQTRPNRCRRTPSPAPGAPLALDEIGERLDEYGVAEMESDATLDEPVDMSAFEWAEQTRPYAAKMIDLIGATEAPPARHPWMLIKPPVAHRRRPPQRLPHPHRHQRAVTALTTRLQALCDSGSNARRRATASRVADILRWGEPAYPDSPTPLSIADGTTSGLRVVEVTPPNSPGNTALPPSPPWRNHARRRRTVPETSFTDTGNAQRLIHSHRPPAAATGPDATLAPLGRPPLGASRRRLPRHGPAPGRRLQLPEGSQENINALSLQAAGLRNMVDLVPLTTTASAASTPDMLDKPARLPHTLTAPSTAVHASPGRRQPRKIHGSAITTCPWWT